MTAKPQTASLNEDLIYAAASPAGFAWVATRDEAKPYIPADFHLKLAEGIVDIEQGRLELLLVSYPVQHGKELAHSTPIPTPTGWKTHGALRPGDEVFGSDGKPTKVVALLQECESEYEVTFADGTSVLAHGAHEWVVFDRAQRRYRTLETRYLATRKLDSGSGNTHRYMYQLQPVTLDVADAELVVDPYVLGAWLGDGTSVAGNISHHRDDMAVIDEIERRGYARGARVEMNGGTTYRTTFYGLSRDLRAIGVLNNKRIPSNYLRSSIEQRLELLAGLIDTDGSIHNSTSSRQQSSRVRIVLADDDLAADVIELVRTFGWRVNDYVCAPSLSSSGIQGKKAVHYIGFTPNRDIPTRIQRKKIVPAKLQRKIGIRSVRALAANEREPGRCLSVAAADGVYLCGPSMLPTHNSETASVWGSAWMLGLHPTWHIIAATYNTDFAEDRIGRPTRDILERHGMNYFGVGVDQGSHSMKRWNTTAGGGMVAVGADKPVTGRRGDVIIIDDPYPGVKEAMNPRYRADVVEWFTANVLTRRPDPLRMIAIMSRWTDDDFIAWLTAQAEENGWKYRVLDFPAIARCPVKGCTAPEFRWARTEDDKLTAEMDICEHGKRDELGRLPGEALWLAVRPISFLIRQLVDLKSRLFNALFQGRPDKPGGSIFKKQWFRYAIQDGDIIHLLDQSGNRMKSYRKSQCRIFQIVDLASGDTQTLRSGITRTKPKGDYTVIGTFLLCPHAELVVYDIFRDNKIGGVEQIPILGSLRAKHGATRIGIEAVQFQWTAVQQAVHAGLPATAITRGNESKETRAWTVAGQMEAGLVYFMRDAPWLETFETELLAFPNGKNDDQADVLSDAGVVAEEAVTQAASMPQGVRVE